MTTTTTLQHGQQIRVKGFNRLANKITVGTCRGFAAQFSRDGDASHALALANGHATAWANQAPSAMSDNYPGKDAELNRLAAETAAAIEIENGQTVEIEGELFTVKVTGQRYSDPIHFRRI